MRRSKWPPGSITESAASHVVPGSLATRPAIGSPDQRGSHASKPGPVFEGRPIRFRILGCFQRCCPSAGLYVKGATTLNSVVDVWLGTTKLPIYRRVRDRRRGRCCVGRAVRGIPRDQAQDHHRGDGRSVAPACWWAPPRRVKGQHPENHRLCECLHARFLRGRLR